MVPRRSTSGWGFGLLLSSVLLLWSLQWESGRNSHRNAFFVVDASQQLPLAFSSPSATRISKAQLLVSSTFAPRHVRHIRSKTASNMPRSRATSASTGLHMFMGSDGGILGIGTPELLTILLVGYFVLGPSDLYKLTKEIGKFVQNIRTLGSDLTKTVENNLESQLQLDELRKAQRELNDAFSFRRSINKDVSPDAEDDSELIRSVEKPEEGEATTTAATTAPPVPTKKIRKRRVKKVVPTEEESLAIPNGTSSPADTSGVITDWESPTMDPNVDSDWSPSTSDYDSFDTAEQRRFQAQMDVDAWNSQIMSQQQQQQQPQQQADLKFVLSKIMERLELLEEEKNAADALLQEEFRLRLETEEKYYREKRQILEEAVVELQDDEYATVLPNSTSNNSPARNNTTGTTATAGTTSSSDATTTKTTTTA